ncbi:MAG: pilus assembly protein PilP [Legionella sp.]|uniref:pilus assembly protein PilP n=1 Tax=Legionella sp. TaxID=459 RepID=UPI0039E322E8
MSYKNKILFILFVILSASCSDDSDLQRYIQQIKQRKTRFIAPIPTFAPVPEFKFPNRENRRSPFKISSQRKMVDSYTFDPHRMKQILEAYPLDTLKFVGTLTQDNEMWGLIKQPDNQITHIHVGDYVGQNYGRIILIKNNLIKLDETIKSSSGKWERHISTLKLYVEK